MVFLRLPCDLFRFLPFSFSEMVEEEVVIPVLPSGLDGTFQVGKRLFLVLGEELPRKEFPSHGKKAFGILKVAGEPEVVPRLGSLPLLAVEAIEIEVSSSVSFLEGELALMDGLFEADGKEFEVLAEIEFDDVKVVHSRKGIGTEDDVSEVGELLGRAEGVFGLTDQPSEEFLSRERSFHEDSLLLQLEETKAKIQNDEHGAEKMNTIVIKALAKINLAIDVLRRREDNYHDIDMVTIPLTLHDSIEITHLPRGYETYLFCDNPTIVCDESNLAYKALEEMRKSFELPRSFKIFIYKKIPVEAGLGGGSADAAAVIRAIDHFLPPSQDKEERIRELASRIGSDVPFCLYDRPSRVQGKGEVLTPIEVGYPYHVLIVKPSYGLSTKSVYEAFDTIEETIRRPNIERLIDALKKDDEEGMRQSMANVLSVPAIKALPLIGEILERMNAMGLPLNGMSGTGSACFALSKDKRHLERVAHVFEKEGNQAYVTQFCLAR